MSAAWKGKPLVIASLDTKTAFDCILHTVLEKALQSAGLPLALIAAFLEQLADLRANMYIPGIGATPDFEYWRGGRQGGPETPDLFNFVLDYLFDDVVDCWNLLGVGFEIDQSGLFNHVFWADNLFLIGTSVEQVEAMILLASNALYENGFEWKLSEGCIICGMGCEEVREAVVKLPNEATWTIPVKNKFKCLGATLDRLGDTWTSWNGRTCAAAATFGKTQHLLLNPKASRNDKIHGWCMGPVASAVYAQEGAVLSPEFLGKCKAWENSYLRRILKLRRRPGQFHASYCKDTDVIIQTIMLDLRKPQIHHRTLRMNYRWVHCAFHFSMDDGRQPLRDLYMVRASNTWEFTKQLGTETQTLFFF